MLYDMNKANEYNAEFDGFEVRFADGSFKTFGKYGHAVRYLTNHIMGEPKIIGHKLDLESLKTIETALSA